MPIQPRGPGGCRPARAPRHRRRDRPRTGHGRGRAFPRDHRLQQHPARQLGPVSLRRPRLGTPEADDGPRPRLQRRHLARRALGRVHLRADRQPRPLRARPARRRRAAAAGRGPRHGGRGGHLAGRRAASLRQHAGRQRRCLRDAVPARGPVRGRRRAEPDRQRGGRLQPGVLARRHTHSLLQQPRHGGGDELGGESGADLPRQRAVRDAGGRDRRTAAHPARELGRRPGVDAGRAGRLLLLAAGRRAAHLPNRRRPNRWR